MNKWNYYSLEKLGKITSSKRIFESEYVTDGIPFYRTKEIKELANKKTVSTELFITKARFEEIKKKFGIPTLGDILITAIGTIGEIYVIENNSDFYFKDGNILWLRDFKDINPYFLKYFLRYVTNELNNLSSGSAYKALPIEKLKKYKIPLPPIAEQKRIAAILDKADAIRRKRQEAIKLTEKLGRSLFLDMFGDPVTNPKGWELFSLESITKKITDGEHLNPTFTSEGIPMIMANNVRSSGILFNDLKYISGQDYERFRKKCNPEVGDLLLVSRGATIGRSCIVDINKMFCLMGSVILIKPQRTTITPQFLCSCFSQFNFINNLTKTSGSSAQQAIYLKDLKKVKIPVPPYNLQQKFSLINEKITERNIKYFNVKLESENLFSSLLQRAFKGEL
jgi:type I restriction enzyme S subunit